MKKIAIIVMLLSLPLMANMQSLKTDQQYGNVVLLFFDYQLEPPEVSSTLKYKGKLRISWSFDVKYNKNIDLIFFPEENPYINYAVLYAKDFPKTVDKSEPYYKDKQLSSITLPPHINDDFVKEVLAQSDLSKAQQEQFFQSRFGSVFVPMEIEFEWYNVYWSYIDTSNIEKAILFPRYDRYLNGILVDGDLPLCLGVIKSYKVLPKDTPLKYPDSIKVSDYFVAMMEKVFPYTKLFTPLPTAAIAYTQTKPNDFIVNVRDKPNKEGKIVTQLLSQDVKIPDNFYSSESQLWRDESIRMGINPLYEKMVSQGYEWYHKDNENSSTDNEGYFMYYQWKTQQAYLQKEKSKLINPLESKDYLILVWNIEPNEWAKVWVLKMIRDGDWGMYDKDLGELYVGKKQTFKEYKNDVEYPFIFNYDGEFISFLYGSYTQTFFESPSTLKLYEGYIHTNSLQYLAPFGQSYINQKSIK